MKWVLLVLGACGAITLFVVLAKRWNSIGPGPSPMQRAMEEDLAANHSDTAARRAFEEGQATNDLDAAIAKFTEAIRLQPDMADAYLERGIAYSDRGQLVRAIADFSETVRLEPQFAEAYRGRALAYRSSGQSEKARMDLQRFDELSDPGVVRRLFQKHIPEIAEGLVEIKAIARSGGTRTKIAVHAANPRVDAVRACVGPDTMRIKMIVDELGGERIDLVRWNESLQVMIPNALQPAQVEEVFLYALLGRAIVMVKEDGLPLAIGRWGQNVRLASRLVGWDIELMTHEELSEGIRKAESWFKDIPGVSDVMVEALIEEGFFSYQDLAFLKPPQLADLVGVSKEQAAAMILFADRAAARIEPQTNRARKADLNGDGIER